MKLSYYSFTAAIAILLLDSCASYRFTQDSGAMNVLNVSLDDPNISYEEVSVPLEGKSWGGILLGARSNYAVDASVIRNNNGAETGYVNTTSDSNFRAFLTGAGEVITITHSIHLANNLAFGNPPPTIIESIGIGIVSCFMAAAVNNSLWNGINQRRVKRQANTQIMEMTPDANFYCMPQSQIVVQPRLFSTTWNGESTLIGATIQGLKSTEGESMVENYVPISERLEASKNEKKPLSISVQPNELLGATGDYEMKKDTYAPFSVVSIEEEGAELSACIMIIEIVLSDGQIDRKKVRASSDRLFFQSSGAE